MSRNSFVSVLYQKLSLIIFLTGKIIRFIFFISFLIFLLRGTKVLAGYTLEQSVFFFLTFNLIDILAQFLFREVYRFRPLIVNGGFDLILVKPINALFRVLMGGADVIDLITLPPLVYALFYVGRLLQPSLIQIFSYLLLLGSGLIIATAFHIAVLALAILTLEIDHTIMIYRDFVALGRFPVDIYGEPIKSILIYLLPVGLMITVPAKALMGLVSWTGILVSLVVASVTILASLKVWHLALKQYTSASS